MCNFKSGIILKNRVVIAPKDNDSHNNLLEQLNIEDTEVNAMTKFVRAELIPPNHEWWTDPDTWKFNVDQDITPDWFNEDVGKYEDMFRSAVNKWCKVHVLVDQKIDELKDGYFMLKRCEVKRALNDVKMMLDNSRVNEMCDNSTVKIMYDNSIVKEMYDNSTVNKMYSESTVNKMFDNSTVNEMYNNSTVNEMYNNSTVNEMYNNSTVNKMYDNSTVNVMLGNSTVNAMLGNSTVNKMLGNSTAKEMYDNSTVKEMWDNSIARCNYKKQIMIAGNYEVIHK